MRIIKEFEGDMGILSIEADKKSDGYREKNKHFGWCSKDSKFRKPNKRKSEDENSNAIFIEKKNFLTKMNCTYLKKSQIKLFDKEIQALANSKIEHLDLILVNISAWFY